MRHRGSHSACCACKIDPETKGLRPDHSGTGEHPYCNRTGYRLLDSPERGGMSVWAILRLGQASIRKSLVSLEVPQSHIGAERWQTDPIWVMLSVPFRTKITNPKKY